MADWRTTERKRNSIAVQSTDNRRYVLGIVILRFLNFTENNRNGVDRMDDRLENKRLISNSKDELSKILQPIVIFGTKRSHCEIQEG